MRSPGLERAVVMLALLLWASVVRADVAPSFVKEMGDSGSVTLRFDNLADYPDYDFYLKYGAGNGNPYAGPHLVPVHAGEAVRAFDGSRRRTEIYLLAVPRGQQQPAVSPSHDWITQVPPGCLQSARLDGTYAGSGYLVPYDVRIGDGALEAIAQPSELLPVEWSSWWLKQLPCIAVPIAFCAVLGWLGARIAHRMFPPKSARKV